MMYANFVSSYHYEIFIFFNHFSSILSLFATSSPFIASPSFIVALGQSLTMSFKELEKPLPPWVMSGQMTFPEKS